MTTASRPTTAEGSRDAYDVAIIGFGPTGMVLAALLGQAGRSVVVLERFETMYNLPRAAGFEDESMRTFQKLGVAERMLHGTNVQQRYVWLNGKSDVLLDVAYDLPGRSGWPSQYNMFQPHLENVLDELVASLPNVDVRRGVTVNDIDEGAEHVVVRGSVKDGSEVAITARYVVGADGGNGFTRQHMAVGSKDFGFSERWLVCDFHLRHEVPTLHGLAQICNPLGPIGVINIGPEYHRFSFRMEMDADSEAVDPATIWPRIAEFMTEDDADLVRVADYVFKSRITETWRRGRLFLAGDAAHEMPPFLAQGMVSGIRDARNLAWKLDMVLAGYSDALLDTYEAERKPHVSAITERAIELGGIQTMRDVAKAEVRDAAMIAARKAKQEPDKFIYPPLKGGLVANDGSIFPQGLVSTVERTALFDEIVGTGWLLVVNGPRALSAIDPRDREGFAAMEGTEVDFGFTSAFYGSELSDTGGVYSKWFAQNGFVGAIVRPDSYLFGTARDAAELATLTKDLIASVGRR